MSSDYARIEAAIRHLEAHAAEQPGLAELAAVVGLSPFHFQRLFHRWAGVTPKTFLQALTLREAKQRLLASESLLATSHGVGLSGPSRLHDLFLSLEAMTPGEFKAGAAGLDIRWGLHATPFGSGLFAATERGLCGLAFVDGEVATAVEELRARWPGAALGRDEAFTAPFAAELDHRARGQAPQPLALLLKGTPFQLQVWEALLRIPEGAVASYEGLAAAAGSPGASRAAGTALGANPLAYLIPCHRVIRATGAFGQYQWGAPRKRAILALEAARTLERGA
ncbi:MAG: methylated-DNA--[protein]-cysteine S-methyltransferase [Holophagaceae bacterium]|nr:methylated-DNA--[protein]-cysteine S-methyltransferase [Holophagaceae bacterium]